MKPEDEYAEEIDAKIIEKTTSDPIKLGNLLKRRKVYGDIVQNATKGQLERLLVRYYQYVSTMFPY